MKVLILSFLLSIPAFAYIPQIRTILDKTVRSHGSGSYQIKQEILFQTDNKKLRITENWTIKDSDEYLLHVTGPNLEMNFLYIKNKRYLLGADNKLVTNSKNPNMIEDIFFTRELSRLTGFMVANEMAGSHILKDKAKSYKLEDIKTEEEPNIRLTRLDGLITYGISKIEEKGEDIQIPSIWIEQDVFRIKKIRLKNSFEITADQYKKHSRGFWWPSYRKVNWDNNSVEIRHLKTAGILVGNKTKTEFQTANLKKKKYQWELVPEFSDIVKSFYNNFR